MTETGDPQSRDDAARVSTAAAGRSSAGSRLRLGTAPDSWGVWFPDDPRQVPWSQFLDEAAGSGYSWIELGPFGYLPAEPGRLRDELDQRGLRLSGATVAAGLHRGPDALAAAARDCREVAAVLTELGARHLVLLPEQYTDLDGRPTQPAELDAGQWQALTSGASELARLLDGDFGIQLVFHPHADSHVDTQGHIERFLDGTDQDLVRLCLDTGHVAYCGGDNVALIRQYPDRIAYVHLKQVDPEVLARVRAERLGFAQAVRLDAMVEPPNGLPAMEPLLAALDELGTDLFAIVEQDMFPCAPDRPLPIATRTRRYYGSCGLGPGPARR
jgi:inosose dehydratase